MSLALNQRIEIVSSEIETLKKRLKWKEEQLAALKRDRDEITQAQIWSSAGDFADNPTLDHATRKQQAETH